MSAAALILFTIAATIAQVLAAFITDRIKGRTYAGQIERLFKIAAQLKDAGYQTHELSKGAHEMAFDAIKRLQSQPAPKEPKPRTPKAKPATGSAEPEIPFDQSPLAGEHGGPISYSHNRAPSDEHPDRVMLNPEAMAAGLEAAGRG